MMPRLSYPERRAQALALAAAYDGWGRPPRPEGEPWVWARRLLPHKLALRLLGAVNTPKPDPHGFVLVKDSLSLRGYFEAKEKRQNREKFD